jgi:hypothetical protein
VPVVVNAQDLVFSQPYAISQAVNPAFVGTGAYKQRVQSDLRSQFVGGSNLYSTIALGWDTKINNKNSDINNYMGIGVQILSDRLMSGVIQNNYISFNLAYHIYLDQNLYQNLALALGGSIAQTTFDKSKLFFGDQYNSAGGLLSTGSMENLIASPSSGVANTGVLYSNHNEKSFLQVGVSANFSNKPNYTYNYINETNGMRLLGIMNAETSLFYNNTILLHGQYSIKEGVSKYSGGMAFSFPITTNWELTKRLYIGCFTRNAEVIMPTVSFLSDKHSFGFSYDFNITKANAAQLRQNILEISFSKSFGNKKGPLFRTLFD